MILNIKSVKCQVRTKRGKNPLAIRKRTPLRSWTENVEMAPQTQSALWKGNCLVLLSVREQVEVLRVYCVEVLVTFLAVYQHLHLLIVSLNDCADVRSKTVELCDYNSVFFFESMVQNCLLCCCKNNAQSDGSGFVRFWLFEVSFWRLVNSSQRCYEVPYEVVFRFCAPDFRLELNT